MRGVLQILVVVMTVLSSGHQTAEPRSMPRVLELTIENRDWQDLDYLRGRRSPRNVMPALRLARSQEPVTSGVPLPVEWNVRSVDELAVFAPDGHTQVEAQFRVLARHHAPADDGTAAIKVVLVDFRADVPSGGSARYVLRHLGARPRHARSLASEDGAAVRIDTGALRAVIHKHTGFTLFSEMALATGSAVETVIPPGSPGGLQIRYRGRLYSSETEPADVALEENGPLRTVVRVHGMLRELTDSTRAHGPLLIPPSATNPISYTAWLTFFQRKSYVKVVIRVENENRGWGPGRPTPPFGLYLDSVELVSKIAIAGLPRVTTPQWQGTARAVRFEQRWTDVSPDDESSNFSHRTLTGEKEIAASPGRAHGWLTVDDATKTVTIIRRFFWQEHPATLEVDDGTIRAGLLPAGLCNDICETGAYRFWGGYHKTFELLYDIRPGRLNAGDIAALQAVVGSPLFARLAPSWYAAVGAFGPLAPFGLEGHDEASENALRARERWARVKYDPSYDENGRKSRDSIYTYRERRPFVAARDGLGMRRGSAVAFYGWERFGEIYSSRGAGGQAYGWSGLLLRSFLESAELEFLNLGLEFASHHADIDVVHDGSTGPDANFVDALNHGAQRYENDAHNQINIGSLTGAVGGTSHAWSDGEMLAYLLTGDPRFRESVEAQAEHARRAQLVFKKLGSRETRQQGWAIRLMLNAYWISGTPAWLDAAMRIFHEGILERERDAPPGYTGYTTQHVWSPVVTLAEAIRSGDRQLRTTLSGLNPQLRFPDRGVVRIAGEEIAYGAVVGDVLSDLRRGVNGTPPAAHPKGATVELIVTEVPPSPNHLPLAGVASAHLLYDLIVGTSLVELHDVLAEAGRDADAKAVQDFLVRMARFLRETVWPSYTQPPGSTDRWGRYYPFAMPYLYRSDLPTTAVHPQHGLWAADIFAFASRATHDPEWLGLARHLYTDSMNYYMHVGWFKPFTAPRPRVTSPRVLMLPTETWAKVYALSLNGRYYLHTEFLRQQVRR